MSMRVGVIGINHKQADVKLREALAQACQRRFALTNPLDKSVHFVLLSTCNRTEIYFSSADQTVAHQQILAILREEIPDEFEQKLYCFFGFDCFLHLARVTAGLDSAIIAETEIQGQVRGSYEAAMQLFPLSPTLHFLFQKSLRIGKDIRSSLNIERNLPGLPHAVWNTGKHFFKKENPHTLFVGASDTNLKLLRFFKAKGRKNLFLCNRTSEIALNLSEQETVHFMSWHHLKKWAFFDWIICATKSPHYLIHGQNLRDSFSTAKQEKKLLIDLSVPRNIDPQIPEHFPQMQLINIDTLNTDLEHRQRSIQYSLCTAERTVEQIVRRYCLLFSQKQEKREQFALLA